MNELHGEVDMDQKQQNGNRQEKVVFPLSEYTYWILEQMGGSQERKCLFMTELEHFEVELEK